jgi:rhodanese-related sulfurtransferase
MMKQSSAARIQRSVTVVTWAVTCRNKALWLLLGFAQAVTLHAQPSSLTSAMSDTSRPQVESRTYALLLRTLLSHSVPEIGPAQAAALGSRAIWLDSREPAESTVSRIAGALPVGYDHFDPAVFQGLDRSRPLVVYCSVGYRSEKMAEKAREAGFKEVYNLYGGIFEWVNQGYPVVDSRGQPTEKVHAYSRSWGRFLNRGEKVYP